MPSYEGDLTRSLLFSNDETVTEFLSTYKVGSIIEYSEFISATYGSIYNPNGQVQIYILNSKNGKDISLFNPQESEVLYPRNSRFLVIDIIKISQDNYEIYLKEAT